MTMVAAASEWIAGFSIVLLLICAGVVLTYAFKELRDDYRKRRGQFGLAVGLICSGAAIVAASYLFTGCILLSLGTPLAIRLVTIDRWGELAWIAALIVAAAVTTVVRMVA